MSIRPAWQQRADVVVIGTGVAGLAAALAAHRAGRRVIVLSKARRRFGVTATHYAQGGIAVVLPDTDDSIEAHVADTLAAGAGLCDADAVRSIVADGYRAVAELVSQGARFDEATAGEWALSREGGHSRRRIVHAGGDATGAEVQRALDDAAGALDIRTDHAVLRLLRDADSVTGVLVANPDGVGVVHAASVILATGGLGHLYGATTNPDGSTGDGIALALWAGVAVSDIEFIQFHPTMLYDACAGRGAGSRRPLVTEAIRGEGAVLVDSHGNSVTAGVHPMGDLAPRDVVAAAVDARLRATGDPCVYLDARSIADFEDRFPTVTAACRKVGVDPVRQPIPVVPGAHYSCGGVVTDVHGQTELPGLYAAGEVARNRNARRQPAGVQQPAGGAGRRRPGGPGRGGARGACRTSASDGTGIDRPSRAGPRRPAAGDEPRCLGRPRRRWSAPVGRHTGGCAAAGHVHPCRPRRRGVDRDRPRGCGRRAGPRREPRLPPPGRIPRRRRRAGAQHRRPAGR